MRERTVTISGASKTFSVTGWRVGWIVAPAGLTDAIRKVHDFLTVGAPAPLQAGVAAALDTLDEAFYAGLATDYRRRRDLLHGALLASGFQCTRPEGAYYILADYSALAPLAGHPADDTAFSVWLSREIGVTPVPGSSFFRDGAPGRPLVRFVFCKSDDVLGEAARRLATLQGSADRREGRADAVEAGARSGWQR
jgi:aminotransferase